MTLIFDSDNRVWRTGTGNSRYREFFIFLVVPELVSEKICTGKKVSEPVSVKFGTDKKSRNRYRPNLVPEKSLGTGIGKIWYQNWVLSPKFRNFKDFLMDTGTV